VLNAFPYTPFRRHRLLTLTGVKSRFAVSAAGAILMVLVCSKLAAIVAAIPPPSWAVRAVLFGMVGASGIQMLAKANLRSNTIVSSR